jgi:hypothetical protein
MGEPKKPVSPVSPDAPDAPVSAEVIEADRSGRLASVSPLHELDPTKTARYRIQVQFGKDRTIQGPNVCGITLWESGRKFHGGGDTLMYWCAEMDTVDPKTGAMLHKGTGGCGGIIPDAFINAATVSTKTGDPVARQLLAQCPHCGGVIPADRLTSIKTYRATTDRLAEILSDLWHKHLAEGGLNGDADVYLKYSRHDMRYIAMEAQLGSERARELKGLSLYPLANILKDALGGATVESCFRAFLKS